MNKIEIVNGVKVTLNDVIEAAKLDNMVYAKEYVVDTELCKQYYKKNKYIYVIAKEVESGNVIGYINCSPVTDETYAKMYSGDYYDDIITADDILEYEDGNSYNLYFSSVVVHPDYRNCGIAGMMLAVLEEFFAELKLYRNITINRIVGDCISDGGIRIAEYCGLKYKHPTLHNTDIMEYESDSQIVYKFVNFSEEYDTKLFRQFYDEICAKTFIEDECEEFDSMLDQEIRMNNSGQSKYFAILAVCDNKVLGGIVFDYFKHTNCMFTEYVAVREDARAKGIGSKLVWLSRMISNLYALEKVGSGVQRYYCEVEAVDEVNSEMYDAAKARAKFWKKQGLQKLEMQYIQPPLGDDKEWVSVLDLWCNEKEVSDTDLAIDLGTYFDYAFVW